jgi:hypothetical protein
LCIRKLRFRLQSFALGDAEGVVEPRKLGGDCPPSALMRQIG